MAIEPGSIDHLSEVISHVVAPSFLLGAVAGFISILLTRLNSVLERLRLLNSLPENKDSGIFLKNDIPRQQKRAALLNKAIFLGVLSGVGAVVLIIVSFATAMFGYNHVWGAAILFVISLSMLFASLIFFALEISIGLSKYDHH